MGDVRRDELRRKYLTLGVGELAAAAVFAAVSIVTVLPRLHGTERWALWSALVPLLVVLAQAGAYWLAARRWVLRAGMPAALSSVYRAFRIVDVVVLAGGLAGVARWWPERLGAAWMVAAVWLFAVVEYLNYFVVRLSYPVGRWPGEVSRWRTPRLVQDISGGQRRPDLTANSRHTR